MRFSRTLVALALVFFLSLRITLANDSQGEHVFHHENVMGTSLELRVWSNVEDVARRTESRVLSEIDRLSAIFSSHDPKSEFRRWQAAPKGPIEVSSELIQVLQASDRWRTLSQGAFDPRVRVLSQLWTNCARENRMPSSQEIDQARQQMSIHQSPWRLDLTQKTAERLTDCPLTLDAIAKGYILDMVCRTAFDTEKPRGLMLNVGGDLRIVGDVSKTLGVASPQADSETTKPACWINAKGNESIATSGNYQRGFLIQNRWFSHIFDPRTGQPVEQAASATVVAKTGADADALATICNVLPIEACLRLASSLEGVECLLIAPNGQKMSTKGWSRRECSEPKLTKTLVALATVLVPGQENNDNVYEMSVKFEINNPDNSRRYRRPYLAVWIEDKDGFPVRTLSLWVQTSGPGPRWIPDLRRWYKSDQARQLVDDANLVTTISRATRAPGKYTLIWDGKDDHGQAVKPGEYVLYIEAAREHGTYQSIRKPFKHENKPFSEELKGNVEIKSASVEYRRKSNNNPK